MMETPMKNYAISDILAVLGLGVVALAVALAFFGPPDATDLLPAALQPVPIPPEAAGRAPAATGDDELAPARAPGKRPTPGSAGGRQP
jgi:hypothetical protein